MRFEGVHIAGVGIDLPREATTSLALEQRLAPLYGRLGLHAGRLELMSGIRERRHYAEGERPSSIATRAGDRALADAATVGLERARLGLCVFSAVCRDFLEPATASVVHHALGLPHACPSFDLSNACLGFANAMVLAAEMIDRRAIDAALVVAGEDGGPLVRETLRALEDPAAGRRDLKRAYASLTIGSGGAAMVLAHSSALNDGGAGLPRLIGASQRAATEHNGLCQGDLTAGGGPLMETDAEALLHAGVALARETWGDFEAELGWRPEDVERVVTHQVGAAHRKALFGALGLDLERDHPTVETLGNIGSVSLPLTWALGRADGFIRADHRTALLGIGSGLNCSMLALA